MMDSFANRSKKDDETTNELRRSYEDVILAQSELIQYRDNYLEGLQEDHKILKSMIKNIDDGVRAGDGLPPQEEEDVDACEPPSTKQRMPTLAMNVLKAKLVQLGESVLGLQRKCVRKDQLIEDLRREIADDSDSAPSTPHSQSTLNASPGAHPTLAVGQPFHTPPMASLGDPLTRNSPADLTGGTLPWSPPAFPDVLQPQEVGLMTVAHSSLSAAFPEVRTVSRGVTSCPFLAPTPTGSCLVVGSVRP